MCEHLLQSLQVYYWRKTYRWIYRRWTGRDLISADKKELEQAVDGLVQFRRRTPSSRSVDDFMESVMRRYRNRKNVQTPGRREAKM